jgi:hypothetical protein
MKCQQLNIAHTNIIEMIYNFQEFQDSKPRAMCIDQMKEQIQSSDILLLA